MLKSLYQSAQGTTEAEYNLSVIAEAQEMTYRAQSLILCLAEYLALAKETLEFAGIGSRIPGADAGEVLAVLGFLQDMRGEMDIQADAINYQTKQKKA